MEWMKLKKTWQSSDVEYILLFRSFFLFTIDNYQIRVYIKDTLYSIFNNYSNYFRKDEVKECMMISHILNW